MGLQPWETARFLAFPYDLYKKIRAFLAEGHYGNIEINVKAGRIESWSLTETGRIDKSCNPKVD